MRLRKGQKNYKLPKDYAMLESAVLRKGRLDYPLYHIDEKSTKELPSLMGMPSYVNFKTDSRRQITFYPTPDRAYYCGINYFVRKTI